ncbi:MAG: tRNA pseudouridine(55) synthase TruB [Verrucomicrobia bacterium CG_4_10_14_3_um_filter_43_23]|nr:MAG: tRNA pseudouridine(55) synthase TruB [Verrucomicrobia bacterium CG1_02_43_26]PIP58942.1 MAG: tRNA pseudouridine(55) synthase TruB [Verrucomicrobia bacterium CG22_combo_CG10-13_8_21_14_all_43_17]PIX57669.1 MAG: tRNA pseudouridine(55) synthase TruB [Verrucomicrobia bacterium CG_4_10_14_3_um_filter_43_23]PIY61804.1 MAG: tRNA pseudouridine(55) synthase TruB [Verrucomicrobia bacterium CG_4_10_14_0_8_um_filter_43_34]PJA44753.1 MAG: tRNA pseudouridine(55) synthase TruB [Verrucomicrobia bacteri
MSIQQNALEGILLIDKPSGITSHDVVDRVRKKLKMKRIGHAGTLDPLATGLLVILVGKATKASQYLMNLDKEYEATMKLGEVTDSHDADGVVTLTRPIPELTEESTKDLMTGFLGDQYQIPPMFSAKKVNGVPLYKMARQGKVIEREPRFITVYKFELLDFALPLVSFRLKCSKGTYVRTIAHDLGEKIGCGSHLTQLRRTTISHLDVTNACTLDKLEELSLTEIKDILIPVIKAIPPTTVI